MRLTGFCDYNLFFTQEDDHYSRISFNLMMNTITFFRTDSKEHITEYATQEQKSEVFKALNSYLREITRLVKEKEDEEG